MARECSQKLRKDYNMKTVFKFLIVSGLMAGAGVGGYFLARKKYIGIADREVEAVKKSLSEYYENTPKDFLVDDSKKEEKKEEPLTAPTAKSSIDNKTSFLTEDKYVDYSKQYRTASVEQKLNAKEEATKKQKHNEPYIISMSEYENSDFAAKTLYFYAKDSILTDSDGRQIENPEDLVGLAALTAADNTDSVYVRNEKLAVDFEVIIETGSFYNVGSNERVIPEEYEK